MTALPSRADFLNLIASVRANGACPDAPLLAVYDALRDRVEALEKKGVNVLLVERLAEFRATIGSLTAQLATAQCEQHTWWEKFAACDRTLREAQATVAQLRKSNTFMLTQFTAMRRAAGGHDDTMEEAVARVATLRTSHEAMGEALKWFQEGWDSNFLHESNNIPVFADLYATWIAKRPYKHGDGDGKFLT